MKQGTKSSEEEVFFQSGELTLAGTLLLPSIPPPYPAVIIVHGASPNIRAPYRNYATRLFVERGVAVLLYDKRGAGESSGNTEMASLEELAEDALAGVSFLKARPEIDPQRIGLIGDSQAGYVIPIAAARSPDVAFIVMVSASAVSPAQQEAFSIEQRLRKANQPESVVVLGRRLRQLIDEYANAVREGQLPAPPPVANSSFVRLGTYHDPIPLLEQITQPALVILGEADEIVPTGHSAVLFDRAFQRAGNQDYTILLYPHANHAIQVPTTDTQDDNTFEFVEGYHDTLSDWVLAHGRGTASTGAGIQGNAMEQSAAFSEAGIYGKLPWYGGAATQLTLLLWFGLVFSSACIILPISALREPQPERRRAAALPMGVSLLNLILLGTLVALAVEVLLGGNTLTLAPLFALFPLLTLLSAVLAMGMVVQGRALWKNRGGAWKGQVYFSILTVSAVLFVPFLLYWNFPGLSM